MVEDGRHVNASTEFIHRINAKNCKVVACFVVTGFVVYHGIIHLTYGIDTCKWLLSDGRFQGYHVWQPYGCMLHTYSNAESRMCMRYIAYWGGKNHIVFMGDSRIRQLYRAFVHQVQPSSSLPEEDLKENIHHNLKFVDKDLKLTVEFLWNPMVDAAMRASCAHWLSRGSAERPTVLVLGSGTWSIKLSNGSSQAVTEYKANVTQLVPSLDRLANTTRILWLLQDPVVPEKLHPARRMITNELIDGYNEAATHALRYSNVELWSSIRLISEGYHNDQEDGLHTGAFAVNYAIQILTNMYCNDHMNYNDGTCCSSSEPVTMLQIITFSAFGVISILALAMIVHRHLQLRRARAFRADDVQCLINGSIKQQKTKDSWYILLTNLSKLGLIMGYFFLCDRTNFFMKENKYYTHLNFFLPVAYVFALGLFFTEETQHTQVLHRDQTNEWKGWMQLIILIYHTTGASQVLPIYMHVRVLVTSYLFLTGYGHFTYFWQNGDFGLYRLWQMLFRMNLLVVVLCLSMNRPYQFYYFVPLVSFWFVVVFVTMTSIPQVVAASAEANPLQYLYIVLKFVGLFSVVTILYMSEVFFEKIFVTRPWKALFVTTDDSIKEWWFRWKIDRYSVASGMLFAFAHYLLKQYRVVDDNHHGNLFSRGLSLTVTLGSLLGLGFYTTFALVCRAKPDCNEIHAYVSFVPIISYIILRNISGLLRTRYSTFFAWFGKISLELFIAQYHIWLAADTHGVLVLVPGYPVLNVIVTSFIFVCISHEIHLLTEKLVVFAIPADWRYMVRNLSIFFLILIPIGIHDGMF
uniref:Putative conserved plasma membrane protein n=2 Tax=Ixodes ricinus TaxID=34613 RepID=V5HCC7_IXORI